MLSELLFCKLKVVFHKSQRMLSTPLRDWTLYLPVATIDQKKVDITLAVKLFEHSKTPASKIERRVGEQVVTHILIVAILFINNLTIVNRLVNNAFNLTF